MPDSTLGPYRLLEQLGRGGMGIVYRAEHRETGQQVALKTVLVPQRLPLQSLRREIHALARIRHPGIVKIVGHGLEAGVPWYAMELLEGVTLRRWSGAEARPTETLDATAWWTGILRNPPAEAPEQAAPGGAVERGPARGAVGGAGPLTLVRRLCAPLAYLHGEGIVHRDLKPDNVLVRPGGLPVLVDFGLVSSFAGELSRETLQVEGGISGTVAYMAPEQLEGETLDARADLYSLGCILYELVAGRPPFVRPTPLQVLRAHLTQPPEPLSALVEGVPAGLDELVLRLLAKDPRDRLGHAADVAAALARLESVEETPEPSPRARAYLYRPRMAGREAVFSELCGRLERAERGEGSVVLLGGESGVGKTRLSIELARRANQREMLVLTGGCVETGGGPLEALRGPLQAVADRCREEGPAETARVLGRHRRLLAQYEPAFEALPGCEVEAQDVAPLPPDAARTRLFQALTEVFASLTLGGAQQAAPLLVLDDLQWADELTIGFLDHLLRVCNLGIVEAQNIAPLLVVGTYRTEEVDTGLAEAGPAQASPLRRLIDVSGIVSIVLGRLEEPAVASMIGDMLALELGPGGFSRSLARHAEGNPFFVAEYLRTAVAEKLLDRDAQGRWRLAAGTLEGEVEALPLPHSLRELVGRRLDGLPAGALELAEAAAVVGRQGRAELLQSMLGLQEGDLFARLGELLRRQVLEEAAAEHGAMVLRFVHDKIRELAYEGIAAQRRGGLHRAAAEGFEAAPGREEYLAALGHHWELAGEPVRARTSYLAAARKARAGHALAEAERLYRAYLRLTPAASVESVQARNELGAEVLQVRGRAAEAIPEHYKALADARSLDDGAGAVASLRALGFAHRALQRYEEARGFFGEALELARVLGEELLEGKILGHLASLDHDLGRVEEARARWEQLLPLARRAGDRKLEARTLGNLSILLNQQRRMAEALELHWTALALAREVGDWELEAVMLENLAVLHQKQGRLDEALPCYRQALEIVCKAGSRVREGQLRNSFASLLQEQGRAAEAQAQFQQALAIAHETGNRFLEAYVLLNLAELELASGRLEEAAALQGRAQALGRELGDRRFEGACLVTSARLERLAGRPEASARALEAAESMLREVPDRYALALLHCERGHLLLDAGASAQEALEQAGDIAAEMQAAPGSEVGQALSRLERAQQAFAAGERGRLHRGETLADLPAALRRRI